MQYMIGFLVNSYLNMHHMLWVVLCGPKYVVRPTRKNDQVVAILMKTGLNSASLPTDCSHAFVNNIEQYCYTDSGSTILFNIVDKCEQRGQQNIVQSCRAAGSAFFAVYL
jgi:hypothetical protein